MERYNLIDGLGMTKSEHGDWVRYSEVVNDPAHIPSMQINELCRKLESLGTSIEKGRIEAKHKTWSAMTMACYCKLEKNLCDYHPGKDVNCDYNICPFLKGLQ